MLTAMPPASVVATTMRKSNLRSTPRLPSGHARCIETYHRRSKRSFMLWLVTCALTRIGWPGPGQYGSSDNFVSRNACSNSLDLRQHFWERMPSRKHLSSSVEQIEEFKNTFACTLRKPGSFSWRGCAHLEPSPPTAEPYPDGRGVYLKNPEDTLKFLARVSDNRDIV